ncbi:MAG TPA: phosphoserine phosphatase [Ruminococcus sp.]|nr:phosphoserine phosphatase [Ruminococcus sp.]
MAETEKNVIGVIAAEVNSIEQRQIATGIISAAQESGKKVVVLSNLYNSYDFSDALALENDIYRLMFSPQLCGLILIEESFINEKLRKIVRDLLAQRQDIPIVAIGIYVKALDFPNVRFIDTDDTDDMMQIILHLLDRHHLTKIDILTGFQGNEASERRVNGYRAALESHGIAFDPARVHYGNFWFNSGEELAKQYINGELPLPEAIACANDYMAFGLLDAFLQGGIRVPNDVVVTGYEYIRERIYHSPLLSTFHRGRFELGTYSVRIVNALAENKEPPVFYPPKGTWIYGNSCNCGTDADQLNAELDDMRTKEQYAKWNVLGTMEQQLTLCSNLDEFIQVLGKHQYWVRWVQNMFLCLFENWYDTNAKEPTGLLTCRSVMPWNSDQPAIVCDRYDFRALYARSPATAVHYYLPLFFEDHFFGYYVLEYHNPDTYDDVFRNWMKSISIGLAFLCMKNDIRYLLQCQNLSEQHDALTGLYNRSGAEKAISVRMAESGDPIYAVALKTGVFQSYTQSEQTEYLQQITEVIRAVGAQNSICCRIDHQVFVCAGFPCESEAECAMFGEKLLSCVLHETDLLRTYGMESVICTSAASQPGENSKAFLTRIHTQLERQTTALSAKRAQPHAATLFAIRNKLYDTLNLTADTVCREYAFSTGYFRQIYKDCFGISFHQDAISARISRAVHLLSTTVMSISAIAYECSYEDYNYFLRQFQKVTGRTPGQYRKRL